MPIDLKEMLAPDAVAVVTMEVQRGIVGDLAQLPQLKASVAEVELFRHIAQLLSAARRAGVPVVHCTLGNEAVSSAPNYPGASAMAKWRDPAQDRRAANELVSEIEPHGTDLIVERHHGVSPFTGTELDSVLRRLGVKAIVACGVSLNVGIVTMAAEAVSLGYRVTVATDAVAGVPVEYGYSVIANTIGFLATRLTVKELCDVWETMA